MFTEYDKVRQHKDSFRRLFTNNICEIYLWYNNEIDKQLIGFQLVYNLDGDQKALTWTKLDGFNHLGVDESRGPYPETPLLVEDGLFNYQLVEHELIQSYNESLDEDLKFALDKIINFGKQ